MFLYVNTILDTHTCIWNQYYYFWCGFITIDLDILFTRMLSILADIVIPQVTLDKLYTVLKAESLCHLVGLGE